MKNLIALFLVLAFSVCAFSQQLNAKTSAETFSATALDGKTFDLAELKGKVVVLTFWSTRCAICHSEIPKLNQLVKTYKDNDVVFLGLTMENESKIASYLKKTSFDFNILPNSFGVVLKYADKGNNGAINMGFPAYFLINQQGEIELKTSGYDKTAALDARINQLLPTK
jgi:peroxiredoxin